MKKTIPKLALENRSAIVGSMLVLVGAFGFSTKAVLVKLAYGYGSGVDAVTLMVLRMSFALPFFVIAALWLRQNGQGARLKRNDWFGIFTLGFLGYYLASFLDFSGLAYISAGLERVILFIYPTLVVLILALIGRQNVTPRVAMALLLSYAGIALVFAANISVDQAQVLWGSGLVFASAVSFALFTIGSGVLIGRVGALRFTAYSMTVACLLTAMHYGYQHGAVAVTALVDLPLQVYVLCGTMALISTVFPAFMMSAGIRRIGAGKAAIISSAGPIATIALAAVLLGEAITFYQLVGTSLVMLGVLAVSWKGRR